MKTITKILMLGLLLFPMFAFAQNATEQRDYEVRVEWEDMQGYSELVPYKVPIYYDNDDNVIKHGPLKINFKHDLTSLVRQKCIIAYTVSGNYVNGKLDGAISLEKSATVSAGVVKVKGTLNFVNGAPDGTWSFTETETDKNGKKISSEKLVIIFKDKKLVSFNLNDGKECFTINNNTFSGTVNGKVYKNGVNTSEFIRKTGEHTKPDETVTSLINGFLAGTMSESDLIAKGFGFQRFRPWEYYDYDKLRSYISKLMAAHFMDDAQYSSYSSAVKEIEHSNDINPVFTLDRSIVKSVEEVVSIANTIMIADEVSDGADEITWQKEFVRYRYCYNTNQIEKNGIYIYYFTDEAKLKLEEAIKSGLEERRLEQERIADEIRLQEMKMQIPIIMKICDYLVARATPTSISYDDKVNRCFDSEGLDEYWRSELKELITPFCKIVACELVSFEAQGDNNVAVLDITKYNRKGNITYRLPVTIVNGKILVTSINISNATVVE